MVINSISTDPLFATEEFISLKTSWKLTSQFQHNPVYSSTEPPIDVSVVFTFLDYLQHKGHSPTTMSPFLSAISNSHKIVAFSEQTSSLIVSKLVVNAYCHRPSLDSRFPITVVILDQIVRSVQYTTDSMHEVIPFHFKYVCSNLELTSPRNNVSQFIDVEFEGKKRNQRVTVTFNNFKHNLGGTSDEIKSNHSFGCAGANKFPTKQRYTTKSPILFCIK